MKILSAVDDSPYSEAALEEVASMPWPPETTVRVLSAVEPFVPPAARSIGALDGCGRAG